LNTARRSLSGTGTRAAALAFGGTNGYGVPAVANTESYNGTAWAEVNDLNTARIGLGTAGTQTAALGFGGGPDLTNTELWNGYTWTEVNDLNTGRNSLGGAGTQTSSALGFGGAPGPTAVATCESWNGTSVDRSRTI
jgi:hypothetical protein